MRKRQKEYSKETSDLQLSYDMNAWIEGKKEQTPSRPCLDISTITEHSYHLHSLAELARLPDPTISPARDRHEWQWHIPPGNWRISLTSVIFITSPLVACFRSRTTWRHMKRNERIQGKRKNISTCIISFFVSTPCFARRESPYDDQKKKYGQKKEARSRITRRHRPHSFCLQ